MAIKLYVAARFARKDEVRRIYDAAEERGWEVSEDWTRHERVEIEETGLSIATTRADIDIKGVMEADVFIMLADEPGPGMYVELGAAIAHSLIEAVSAPMIYVILGDVPYRSIFFYHPCVETAESVEEVFEDVERIWKDSLGEMQRLWLL